MTFQAQETKRVPLSMAIPPAKALGSCAGDRTMSDTGKDAELTPTCCTKCPAVRLDPSAPDVRVPRHNPKTNFDVWSGLPSAASRSHPGVRPSPRASSPRGANEVRGGIPLTLGPHHTPGRVRGTPADHDCPDPPRRHPAHARRTQPDAVTSANRSDEAASRSRSKDHIALAAFVTLRQDKKGERSVPGCPCSVLPARGSSTGNFHDKKSWEAICTFQSEFSEIPEFSRF